MTHQIPEYTQKSRIEGEILTFFVKNTAAFGLPYSGEITGSQGRRNLPFVIHLFSMFSVCH
jgi:hypothetical protein